MNNNDNEQVEYQDPFLEGNERIEKAIDAYYRDGSQENLTAILDEIRMRMHEDGHFIVPIRLNEEDSSTFFFRALQDDDGNVWNVVCTSKAEFEKGAPSEVLSFFIDRTLKACTEDDSEVAGIIINPWGNSFMLSKDLIRTIFEADGGMEYIVPDSPVTPELLEGGAYLKNAIEICNRNRTQWNVLRLFRILRDSFIWIPCNAIPDEVSQAQLEEIVKSAGDDPQALIGKTFKSEGAVRMVPDILQNGEEFFFPVFTSAEEMGEYGDHFSKVERHFLEAVAMAQNNERDLSGIVVNAFSEPFVVNKEAFPLIEGMESNMMHSEDTTTD